MIRPTHRLLLALSLGLHVTSVNLQMAKAESPAIRNEKITDFELEARALSLGSTPISQLIADRKIQSTAKQVELEQKLIPAQLEWLEATSTSTFTVKPSSTSAIDSLLALESEDDWDKTQQKAFYEFRLRKLFLSERNAVQGDMESILRVALHIRMSSMTVTDSQLLQTTAFLQAKTLASKLEEQRLNFDSLPNDIVGVFLNGVWFPRSQRHLTLYLPPENSFSANILRLNFISNRFRPKVLHVSRVHEITNLGVREPWIDSGETCTLDLSELGFSKAQAIVFGNESCEKLVGQIPTPNDGTLRTNSLKRISEFGKGPIGIDPFQSMPPVEKPTVIQPWTWAAIGGIVLTALIISARPKDQQVQPNVTTGW